MNFSAVEGLALTVVCRVRVHGLDFFNLGPTDGNCPLKNKPRHRLRARRSSQGSVVVKVRTRKLPLERFVHVDLSRYGKRLRALLWSGLPTNFAKKRVLSSLFKKDAKNSEFAIIAGLHNVHFGGVLLARDQVFCGSVKVELECLEIL